jgi:hypothetical protein
VLNSPIANPVPEPPSPSWQSEVSALLAKAAALAVEHEVDADSFVRSAYAAYLDTRPGMREYLEEQELLTQLEELRKRGLVGKA